MATHSFGYQHSSYDSSTTVGALSHEDVFQQTTSSQIQDLKIQLESLKSENARYVESLQQTSSPKIQANCENCGMYGHLPYNCQGTIEQVNAYQNYRNTTFQRFQNPSPYSNYNNPSQTQTSNFNSPPPQNTFTAPYKQPYQSFTSELNDLKKILLDIKTSQEDLIKKVDTFEKEKFGTLLKLKDQVEELKRLGLLPYQQNAIFLENERRATMDVISIEAVANRDLNMLGVCETVVEEARDEPEDYETVLSIAKYDNSKLETDYFTDKHDFVMGFNNETKKPKTETVYCKVNQSVCIPTDRFPVSGDGIDFSSDFDSFTHAKEHTPIQTQAPNDALVHSLPRFDDTLYDACHLEPYFDRNTYVPPHHVLRDPGDFRIDITINDFRFERCLLDTGSALNIMPKCLIKLAGIDETKLEPFEKVGFRMANGSTMETLGMKRNVIIFIEGKLIVCDFAIVDTMDDATVVTHIIFGPGPWSRTQTDR